MNHAARLARLGLTLLAGCTGTVASVHLPTLPDPGPSKFESFDDWNARVNASTTAATRAATTRVAPTTRDDGH